MNFFMNFSAPQLYGYCTAREKLQSWFFVFFKVRFCGSSRDRNSSLRLITRISSILSMATMSKKGECRFGCTKLSRRRFKFKYVSVSILFQMQHGDDCPSSKNFAQKTCTDGHQDRHQTQNLRNTEGHQTAQPLRENFWCRRRDSARC